MGKAGKQLCVVMIMIFLQLSFSTDPAHSEDNVKIVKNSENGLWNEEGLHSFDLSRTLSIESDDKNEEAVFGNIAGITIDSEYNIYALDYSKRRVLVFDSQGTFRFSFGRQGNGPGEFNFPTAIASDGSSYIYVTDMDGINIFYLDGEYVACLPIKTSGMIRDFAVDSEGNFYLCWFEPLEQDIIHKYNAEGNHIKSFCKSYAMDKDVDVRIESTYAGGQIDFEKNGKGNILFSQLTPYGIQEYTPDGVLVKSICRDNSFFGNVNDFVKISGDAVEFSLPPMSSGIFYFPGNYFMNSAYIPAIAEQEPYSVVDLFNKEGRLLASKRFEYPIFFHATDKEGRVYGFVSEDIPMIVRFEIDII